MTNNSYQCVGFNFKCDNNHLLGSVGDRHTLIEWLVLACRKDEDFLREYFEGYRDKEIAEYLYNNCGVRLIK